MTDREFVWDQLYVDNGGPFEETTIHVKLPSGNVLHLSIAVSAGQASSLDEFVKELKRRWNR